MNRPIFTTIKILKSTKFDLKILAAHKDLSMGSYLDQLVAEQAAMRIARERNAEGRVNFKE